MTPITTRDCRHGRFSFPSRDQYVGRALDLYGEWSEREVRTAVALTRPGDCVVEVGSNIGSHTVPIARHLGPAGMVIALEPQRLVFQILCTNLITNGLFNVRALQAAAEAQMGQTQVPEMPVDSDFNFGGVRIGGDGAGLPVPVITIDSLELQSVALIKIDAEDHEPGVLKGAMATIERCSPAIILEYNPHMRPAINQVLGSLSYRMWHLDEPIFAIDNFRGNSENLLGPYASLNLLLTMEPVPGVTDQLPELHRDRLR